jgi:putative hemin transport protein
METLKSRWQTLKTEQPQLRIRDAAIALGVSELELLCTDLAADGTGKVRRLRDEAHTILAKLPELGKVMALTRNDYVVIEKTGTYNPPSFFEREGHVVMGQVVGETIDLRLFLTSWGATFAVEMDVRGKAQYSLQFFDKAGQAIHKVYLRTAEGKAAYDALVTEYLHPDQACPILEAAAQPETPTLPDDFDRDAFLGEWAGLKDTHDFFGMLRKYNVHRLSALRVAQGQFTWPVPADAYVHMVKQAAESGLSIMCFVGNASCLEIHTGPVKKVVEMEGWFNIMDPGFNLHVQTEGITEAWVTSKPTSDGPVTALECYGSDGTLLVQFFGERKPGRPELVEWQRLAHSLVPQVV